MISIRSQRDALDDIFRSVSERHPQLKFGAKLIHRGRFGDTLEIEVSEADIVQSIFRIIDEVKKRKTSSIEVQVKGDGAESAITREYLNGYFRRR